MLGIDVISHMMLHMQNMTELLSFAIFAAVHDTMQSMRLNSASQ